jgi:hypothetical protein
MQWAVMKKCTTEKIRGMGDPLTAELAARC